jgi:hypothetical protein
MEIIGKLEIDVDKKAPQRIKAPFLPRILKNRLDIDELLFRGFIQSYIRSWATKESV